jgi:hypothetical protein
MAVVMMVARYGIGEEQMRVFIPVRTEVQRAVSVFFRAKALKSTTSSRTDRLRIAIRGFFAFRDRMSEDDLVSRKDTPPLRYGIVEDHPPLYRGSYPLSKNLHFLERLHLKTILSITPEPLGENVATWCSAQGVRMMHLKTEKQAKTEKHPICYYETKQALQVPFHIYLTIVDF